MSEKRTLKLSESFEDKTLNIAEKLILEMPGLMKEFIRAGISNPVVGVAGAIIVSDILRRTGVLSVEGQTAVLVAIGALEAGNLITDIASLLPFHQNASSTEPSAQTVVFGDSGTKELSGLIESIKGKVKS